MDNRCSRAVASYIYKCVTCRLIRGKALGQRMADLPKERIEESPPFTYVGLDCFGPFITKDGRRTAKRYGLLVTCFSTRAVHIEYLDNMTSDAFINALRCVIAIRGPVRTIKCDQGSNFKGAAHELKVAMSENLDEDAIRKFLLDQHCEFIFNSPTSSHMGGLWERCIRSIRSVLDVVLWKHNAQLDSSSLRTFFYEVMAIINGRPLTHQNINDPDAPVPLTPNQLLTQKTSVVVPPPGSFNEHDISSRKSWRRVQGAANEFWNRWRKEYVLTLQNRQKWQRPRRSVKLDDIVLICDYDIQRNYWKLGRVIELLPSQDDRTRRVRLKVGTSMLDFNGKRCKKLNILERPVHKLIMVLENDE